MKIRWLLDKKLDEWLLVIGFSFIVILVFLQVIFRYVINIPISWSEEVSRYILVWMAWVSVSYTIKKQEHIRIDVLSNLLKRKSHKKFLEIIVMILWFAFAVFLTIEGTDMVVDAFTRGQTSPIGGIPIWIVYLAIPVGGILMGLRIIQRVFYIMREKLEV